MTVTFPPEKAKNEFFVTKSFLVTFYSKKDLIFLLGIHSFSSKKNSFTLEIRLYGPKSFYSLKSCSFGLKPLSFTRQVNRVWCGLGDRAFPSCMCSEFEIVRCFTWLSYTIGQIVFFLFICLKHFCLACWCQDEVRICLMAKAFVSTHGICVDQITLKNRKL